MLFSILTESLTTGTSFVIPVFLHLTLILFLKQLCVHLLCMHLPCTLSYFLTGPSLSPIPLPPEWSVLVQFNHSVVSNSLQPHGLQHPGLPYLSPTHRAGSNSSPLSRWCHSTISSSVVPFSSCLQSFPSIRVFSNESVLRIRWPKYWSFSFSISPSNEYSGLISFRMDWLDLLAVQETLESPLQHQSSKASILQCSTFFKVGLNLSHIHTWLLEKP